ncbi:hypothetical protein JTE90_012926 [Oedothorax gibbosus]|uniref:Uncharacterized protein n=1 Tax=Oedothorax gibbosus TaxID=931172 RepID=A0AAV6V2C4_9ARAC|nr:hypothetical protein JTE90_012926 [Oedothorax gibbosus]
MFFKSQAFHQGCILIIINLQVDDNVDTGRHCKKIKYSELLLHKPRKLMTVKTRQAASQKKLVNGKRVQHRKQKAILRQK